MVVSLLLVENFNSSAVVVQGGVFRRIVFFDFLFLRFIQHIVFDFH